METRLHRLAGGGGVEEGLEGHDGLVAGGETALLLELAEEAPDTVAVPVADGRDARVPCGSLWEG